MSRMYHALMFYSERLKCELRELNSAAPSDLVKDNYPGYITFPSSLSV